jgi:PhzF family phenazine biosynthesis protein
MTTAMTTPLVTIDAFAEAAFSGNPAAVCFPSSDRDAAWMQRVTAEMNLAETAFLAREGDAWRLRWFTPVTEVDLCGHATLAAAHLLWQDGHLPAGAPARFLTRSGALGAVQRDGLIELDFPADPPRAAAPPEALVEALGVQPFAVLRGRDDWLVELADAQTVRTLEPDLALLATIDCRGIGVTARGDRGFDVVSRFFAPRAGIPEDPVTGSAHCTIGPYWSARLRRPVLSCWQASARGGRLRVEPRGGRVLLGGTAVTVMRGELLA